MNYEPTLPPPPPPPPPQPQWQNDTHPPQGYGSVYQARPYVDPHPRAAAERGVATAPFVLGVIAAVFGWIPFLCVVTLILALIGLPLGVIAYRRRQRLSKVAVALCGFGLVMSILGFAIMASAFNEVDESFDCIDRAQTYEELDAC